MWKVRLEKDGRSQITKPFQVSEFILQLMGSMKDS